MCYAIYGAMLVLFFLYGDAVVDPLVLALRDEQGAMMGIAVGWEMLQVIWPVILLFAVASSFVTYLLTRRLSCRKS